MQYAQRSQKMQENFNISNSAIQFILVETNYDGSWTTSRNIIENLRATKIHHWDIHKVERKSITSLVQQKCENSVIFLALRNIEWLNRTATTGAICPTKSKDASHSPLSNTGAVWLGFWNPWVDAIKCPHGDQPSRLKNVDPTCKIYTSNKQIDIHVHCTSLSSQ